MDHEEALRIQAPEKYLLGEFSDLERDQFEEHFFTCPACAAEVRAAAVFEANARAVFADEARRSSAPKAAAPPAMKVSWREWLQLRPVMAASWAVSLLLLAGTSYQALVYRSRLADLNAPQAFAPLLLRADTRGDDRVVKLTDNSRFFSLGVQLPPELDSPSYECQVSSEAGSLLFGVSSPAPAPGMPLYLLIPASQFHSGRYKLSVLESQQGSGPRESAAYGFVVQRE
jgi:hypothetical protein